ncbi:MAG: exosome complex protein Rrp42 [Nanoarchaeota archaeon]|nr:exosome complex protein Rrp42 [Nanoarchaeota archaeon]
MEISNINKKKIRESLKEDKRLDGRKPEDFRKIEIETGISKNAEGSARVKIGDTEVIAGIKVDVSEPYPDHEDEGTMITTLELLPLSSSRFEYGPPRIEAIEIARIIDRVIRESGFIDFKKLCIKKGEKVYTVLIDLYTLNDDGNLIDAGCIAAVEALKSAKMPKYDEKTEKIKFGEFSSKSLPLNERVPVTITSYKIGDKIVVDTTREEEDSSTSRISFGLTDSKKGDDIIISSLQKGGEGTFTQEEISKIIDLTVRKFKDIQKETEGVE